jgi:hypothetical protein
MATERELIREQELVQTKRRRGNMLKLIRQGHEAQFERMDDFEMSKMMRNLGANMSQRQVLTMLQDMKVLGYIDFTQRFCEIRERVVAEEIVLTPAGLAMVTRRKDNDEVLFD